MSRQQHHLEDDEAPARVGLRMPESLKRQLARMALDEGLSENALMVRALEEFVARKTAAQSND